MHPWMDSSCSDMIVASTNCEMCELVGIDANKASGRIPSLHRY